MHSTSQLSSVLVAYECISVLAGYIVCPGKTLQNAASLIRPDVALAVFVCFHPHHHTGLLFRSDTAPLSTSNDVELSTN